MLRNVRRAHFRDTQVVKRARERTSRRKRGRTCERKGAEGTGEGEKEGRRRREGR